MLFDYAATNFPSLQRQQDLLGAAKFSDRAGAIKGASKAPTAASGQFDDDPDDETMNLSDRPKERLPLSLPGDALQRTPSKASDQTNHKVAADPLQFLSELASEQPTIEYDDSPVINKMHKSPKRISLSPGHLKTYVLSKERDSSMHDGCNDSPTAEAPDTRITSSAPTHVENLCTKTRSNLEKLSIPESDMETITVDEDMRFRLPRGPNAPPLRPPRKSFEERFRELQHFKTIYGHTDVSTTGEYKGLGRWISNLRCRFRSGVLLAAQVEMLRNLGCVGFAETTLPHNALQTGVKANSSEDETHTTMEESCSSEEESTVKIFGVEVPAGLAPIQTDNTGSKDPVNIKGNGIEPKANEERTEYVNERKSIQYVSDSTFAPHLQRIARQPLPVPRRPQHMQWNLRLNQLGAFVKEFGHAHVTTVSMQTKKKEHQDLSLWLAQQRHLYRKGFLSRNRAHALHAYYGCPGFEPEVAPTLGPMAAALVKKNHYRVLNLGSDNIITTRESTNSMPPAHPSHPRGGHQAYHRHIMPRNLIAGMPVGPPMYPSAPPYEHYAAPQEQPAPKSEAKKARKRGQYVSWHDRLEQLTEFRKKRGHCDARIVLHDDDDSKELGRWLASQRHQYRKGKLPQDKVEILKNLGVQLDFKKTHQAENY